MEPTYNESINSQWNIIWIARCYDELIFLLELTYIAPCLDLVTNMGKGRRNVSSKNGRNFVVEKTSKADMLKENNEMEEW